MNGPQGRERAGAGTRRSARARGGAALSGDVECRHRPNPPPLRCTPRTAAHFHRTTAPGTDRVQFRTENRRDVLGTSVEDEGPPRLRSTTDPVTNVGGSARWAR